MQAIQSLGSILRLFAYFTLAGVTTTFFLTVIGDAPLTTYSSVSSLQNTPGLFHTIAYSDMLGKLTGFVVLPILYLVLSKQKNANPFRQEKGIAFEGISIVAGIAVLLLSLPAINVIAELNKNIFFPEPLKSLQEFIVKSEELAEATIGLFLHVQTLPDILLSFLALAVMPAIGEEIIFRGFFQRELIQQTKNIHLSVWIAAFLFSFIHFQFLGFFPRVLLGALLGYMYVWSGSLLVPILMHFTNNALTLFLLIIYKQGHTTFNPESSEQIPYVFVLVSFTACLAILYNRKKAYDNQLSSYPTHTHE
ncbi:CPBP family intramembrane glutamic endopeptidase [Cytophaga hutchinsonii]|jgi:membrane protease YdiL (CAAX protease family)|uniref:Metal-dependent membrane protease n=1 Tax=Cytophaga hutchinsonii (strain ATCC 33406 / DSM 1761 / CIP 103989 / NBRC 15051 / NCIMB 9469 / D465) TaxID=269798 RepID=A0A6N4SMY9_CYTH3|nr:CPBP family intramembrane glutamic endopeptidase [Cytophaga hutchinsonii]ABG57649.1 metal-dependent membrane protease [Cytophaga hutchinsonii ATCC 33406]SFX01996.1 hypothetical protein SAMN04487930_101210 [Cytophaga hutchinsonii ATCC 33406]